MQCGFLLDRAALCLEKWRGSRRRKQSNLRGTADRRGYTSLAKLLQLVLASWRDVLAWAATWHRKIRFKLEHTAPEVTEAALRTLTKHLVQHIPGFAKLEGTLVLCKGTELRLAAMTAGRRTYRSLPGPNTSCQSCQRSTFWGALAGPGFAD